MKYQTKAWVVACLVSSSTAISFRPPEGTVPWTKTSKEPEWVTPKDHDIDYFVPNFGVDTDIGASLKNLATAEEKYGHQLEASFEPKKDPWKVYDVAHFGEDDDIKSTKANIKAAE